MPDLPSDQELAKYAAGLLSEEGCRRVESYLESAPEAESRWAKISVSDPLIEQLQATHLKGGRVRNARNLQSCKTLVGTTVGRYVIEGLLGSGGMAAVYRAHDPIIGRDIALKILNADATKQTQRSLAEARAQGKLSHPNIVPVYDAGQDGDELYIAMELMEQSVDDILKRSGPLDADQAIQISVQAAQGLAAAHEKGLIHRDIKPANLLLGNDSSVKVADFGLSHSLDANSIDNVDQVGTPYFMSPEQCRAEEVDIRSDIYSLGATFFTMLTGSFPYADSESIVQVFYAHCELDPPDPRKLRSDIPDACTDLVCRAMAKRLEDRYENVAELISALKELAADSPYNRLSDSSEIWNRLSAVPDGPSLVVLPFENLSGDPYQECFSDGITHEITTQLGQFRSIHLISARSAFQFKGKSLGIREVAAELSVQYVLEGHVRRAGDRTRISATLVDANELRTVWTKSYDKVFSSDGIFEIQDEIASSVTSAIAQPYGQLHVAERKKRKSGASRDAYDAILQFYEYWYAENLESYWEVRNRLEEVVDSNPKYAQALAALALVYVNGFRLHFVDSALDDMHLALDLSKRALRIDTQCELAHEALTTVYFHLGELEEFAKAAEAALESHPNHADLIADIGIYFTALGKNRRGMALAEKALALSPRPAGWYYATAMLDAMKNRDFEAALNYSIRNDSKALTNAMTQGVILGHLNRLDEANVEFNKARQFLPQFDAQLPSILKAWNLSEPLSNIFLEGAKLAGWRMVESKDADQ